MKKVLITGGAGFVGRNFTKFFLDIGYDVTVVDSIVDLTGGIHPNKWMNYAPFDFKNFKFEKKDCREWFKENNITDFDYVLHLAAMVGGREIIENSPITVADDLSIDSQFWQWATLNMPKKVVQFSSSACYPIAYQTKENYILLEENMVDFNKKIGVPDLTYGWAKLTSEYLGKIAFEKYGLKSVCYRPFSGYGEDQDLNYPFPSICKRVLSNINQSKITVWGSGDQMRDFIHISDCVAAVNKTMDQINDGSAINLSTGKLTSFKEFVKITSSLLGFDPEVVGTSNKPEGVFARGGDTQLQNKLGIQNKITFKDGISKALEFYNK
ncbi:NAD-dependent epimerase/dehydratase family protein [Alphaproteobacteria bacterium]|nr:NAD-dependent epimerase/dehydratase family protein [Alphaproteobacteria bacterium]